MKKRIKKMLTEEEKKRILYLNEQGWSYVELVVDIAESRRLHRNIERELYKEIAELLKIKK